MTRALIATVVVTLWAAGCRSTPMESVDGGADAGEDADGGRSVRFQKHLLDARFLSEGVALADVNRDGVTDLFVGDVWFQGPTWAVHAIVPVQSYEPATQFSHSFINFAADVDEDGWVDQVVLGFPLAGAFWRKNPGADGGHWQAFDIADAAPQESPLFAKVSGDDTSPSLLFQSTPNALGIWSPPSDRSQRWVPRKLPLPSAVMLGGHGLGVGDVDGDGRVDLVTTRGIFIAPAVPDRQGWRFSPVDLGPDCAQMQVFDINGDGRADVASSSAHDVGVFWHERLPGAELAFTRHTIAANFSQSHALEAADVNGDGRVDLVTGKRMWAHGPTGDVDPNAPKVLYWFEQMPNGTEPRFVAHLIDDDSGVGTQFVAADVTGDGRVDIVVANKRGVHLFTQE